MQAHSTGAGANTVQDGDTPAPTLNLVQELYKFALQHARASASNEAEADDFLQEILITFIEVSKKYVLSREELIKVAKTSARNRIRDLIRSKNVRSKYHVTLEDVVAEEVMFDPEKLELAHDLVNKIEKSISSRARAIMKLLAEGYSYDEITKKLSISKVTIWRYLEEIRQVTYINLE